MPRAIDRKDFPGGLTAAEYLDRPWSDADLSLHLETVYRAWNRVRHSRETLARAGASVHVSRENLRKAKLVSAHDDLMDRMRADQISVDAAYREAMQRAGRSVGKRTTISVSDVNAAAQLLIKHFDADELIWAITEARRKVVP